MGSLKWRWSMVRRAVGLLLLVGTTAASALGTDIADSQDLPGIERYPFSFIVEYQQHQIPEYRLALGRMREVNNVLAPEQFQPVRGQLTRVTYEIPAGHSSAEAYDWVRRQLAGQGGTVLFECAGRDCGSSNDWANGQFGIAKLYGIDREQRYLAVRLSDPETYLAVYAVRRGNRRVYLHVDQVRPRTEAAFDVLTAVRALTERERLFLPTAGDAAKLKVVVVAVKQLLAEDDTRRLVLVGHGGELLTPERSIETSRQFARDLRDRLVDAGIDADRITLYGVGALAPAYAQGVGGERVELLLQ